MTLLAHVTRLPDDERVPHAIIGAAALASAGVSRSTYDTDLLTGDTRVHVERDLASLPLPMQQRWASLR